MTKKPGTLNEDTLHDALVELNKHDPQRPRYVMVSYPMGWHVRDDGDIETHDGVVPLVEFAAAGRIDSVQLEMAREIKRKWLAGRKNP